MLELCHALAPGQKVEECNGQAAIDADNLMIEQTTGQLIGGSRLRLWENERCLVTTKRFTRFPNYRKTAQRSAQRGWPVFVRSTGGTTVVHRPGVLNISLLTASENAVILPNQSYRELCDLLLKGLRKVGVEAELGSVPGSFCDGRYNICVEGRKLAGTASRIVRREGKSIHLCHASITVYGCCAEDASLVSKFERGIGHSTHIDHSSHISLKQVQLR
jgi:octanoyl-[GcvH]:protein N-octanoyltransferase